MGFMNREKEIQTPTMLRKQVQEEPVVEKAEAIVEEVKEEGEDNKHRWVVVKEEHLPTQVVRQTTSADGTTLHVLTIEEALTELLNK